MSQTEILISEVGPRDGLQSIQKVMPTEDKKRWIKALADAGIQEIEVGSFVSPQRLPQMADTNELVQFSKHIPSLETAALIPNLIGARAALDAGAHKISIPFSVSETHCRKNLNRNHTQMLNEIREIRAEINQLSETNRPHFEGSLSTAFGCTLEGSITQSKVLEKAEQLMAAGVDEVGLSDTTGYANPRQVHQMVRAVKSNLGADKLTGIHLHNTRGLGLANALAAYDAGIRTFDSSMAGIGGCPYAPGASGNIVTEDLVFMFDAMGVSTGIDFDRLLEARVILADSLVGENLYGFTPDAGVPKDMYSA